MLRWNLILVIFILSLEEVFLETVQAFLESFLEFKRSPEGVLEVEKRLNPIFVTRTCGFNIAMKKLGILTLMIVKKIKNYFIQKALEIWRKR